MSCIVKSLFDIVLDFLAYNIKNVESFENFPSCIGKQIFSRCVEVGVFDPRHDNKILILFSQAYPNDIMTSLSFCNALEFINEYSHQLLVLFENLIQLDLSYCGLGSDHELIELIGGMKKLKFLSLRKNSISNDAIRKITLPMTVFKDRGPRYLTFLDLSENPLLNDRMTPWISRFKHLKFLNLSGTNITDEGRQVLKKKSSLKSCLSSEFLTKRISTEGWAKPVVNHWFQKYEQQQRDRKKVTFYNKIMTSLLGPDGSDLPDSVLVDLSSATSVTITLRPCICYEPNFTFKRCKCNDVKDSPLNEMLDLKKKIRNSSTVIQKELFDEYK